MEIKYVCNINNVYSHIKCQHMDEYKHCNIEVGTCPYIVVTYPTLKDMLSIDATAAMEWVERNYQKYDLVPRGVTTPTPPPVKPITSIKFKAGRTLKEMHDEDRRTAKASIIL